MVVPCERTVEKRSHLNGHTLRFHPQTQKLKPVYSYFEKGCRKKCTQQSRKVLGVVLSALFFKEI